MSRKDTYEQMQRLVREYRSSGQDKDRFASAHCISKGKLDYWIDKLAEPGKAPPCENVPGFVPLRLIPGPAERAIVIRCGNGVEIEIPL